MMELVSSGINCVRAFGLAAGIEASGGAVNEPLCALVKWRSEHEDKLHQVYVDGEFAGVTTEFAQREIVVPIRCCQSSGAGIEVYAVEPDEAHIDFGQGLESHGKRGRVELGWMRGMQLPFGGKAEVYSDGGCGEIDYESPVTQEGILLWPSWQDKAGFGIGRFGVGDFGFEGCATVGLGLGMFGKGEFGFDADEICWISGELEAGQYKFAVETTDQSGRVCSSPVESEQVVLIRAAQPGKSLEIDSYDKGIDEIEFSVG